MSQEFHNEAMRQSENKLSALVKLGGAVARLERSSNVSKLKHLRTMNLRQTERLLETVIDDQSRFNPDNEISQLAGLLKELSVKFAEDEIPATAISSGKKTDDSANDGPKQLEKFTLFSNLPLEIRKQNWGHTLPGPRVIEIYSSYPAYDMMMSKESRAALGSITKVNMEAYHVVNERYRQIDC